MTSCRFFPDAYMLDMACTTPILSTTLVTGIMQPLILIVMWHLVPWTLPVELQFSGNLLIGKLPGVTNHENIMQPVCQFGRYVSYGFLAYSIARVISIFRLQSQVGRNTRQSRELRAAGWVIYGLMLAGATLMNLHALALMLITLPFEVLMDYCVSGDWRSTAISASVGTAGSIILGVVANFFMVRYYAKLI